MTELLKSLTFRFAPRPSFWEGMGRVLDLAGGLSRHTAGSTPAETDYKALASDWDMVGQDFFMAIKTHEQEEK